MNNFKDMNDFIDIEHLIKHLKETKHPIAEKLDDKIFMLRKSISSTLVILEELIEKVDNLDGDIFYLKRYYEFLDMYQENSNLCILESIDDEDYRTSIEVISIYAHMTIRKIIKSDLQIDSNDLYILFMVLKEKLSLLQAARSRVQFCIEDVLEVGKKIRFLSPPKKTNDPLVGDNFFCKCRI